jgi:hypothetical protein
MSELTETLLFLAKFLFFQCEDFVRLKIILYPITGIFQGL